MTTGEFYIDGINITSTYGIFIHEGGFDGIVSLPEMKEPEVIDWAEENGLEVDLSDPKLKAKEFEIGFATVNKNADINGFINILLDTTYHDFSFTGLAITMKLRLLTGVNFIGTILNLRVFSLRFSEDEPLKNQSYQSPVGGKYGVQGYQIDGLDLSAYGIAVLEGSDAEILKVPEFKQGLVVTNSKTNGAIGDPFIIVVEDDDDIRLRRKMKYKDVNLKLLLTASNSNAFFTNLYSLIYNLTRNGERELYFSKNEENYMCYYLGSNVNNFTFSGSSFWFEFTLTLRVISYRMKSYLYFVSTSGYLKATSTSYTQSDEIIIFAKTDAGTNIASVISFSKSFENGIITIEAQSSIKLVEMSCNNGKLYIQ